MGCVGGRRRGRGVAAQKGTIGGEQAGRGRAAGEGAAELDGVEREVLRRRGASALVGVGAAGRAGELEDEGLAVAARPLGDDVGDDAAVVVRAELERPAERVRRRRRGASTGRAGRWCRPGSRASSSRAPGRRSSAWRGCARAPAVRARPRTVLGATAVSRSTICAGLRSARSRTCRRRQRRLERPAVALAVRYGRRAAGGRSRAWTRRLRRRPGRAGTSRGRPRRGSRWSGRPRWRHRATAAS